MIKALRELVERLDLYLARLELIAARTTETAELTRGLLLNHVLFSGSIQIPATGVWSMDTAVPFAAVAVYNSLATSLTVTNDGAQGAPPGPGPGVIHIPAGTYQQRNIAGRSVSIYGTAGSIVEVELLARADTSRG